MSRTIIKLVLSSAVMLVGLYIGSLYSVTAREAHPRTSFEGVFKNLSDCLVHCESEGDFGTGSRDAELKFCTHKCLKAFPPK
jgi:hypothetical protein